MDPLSAVGVAGTIVQFVTFASTLISKSTEIYNSASGSSTEVLDLHHVSQHLQQLSNKLTVASSEEVSVFRDIIEAAKQDCEKVSDLVEQLKLKDGASRQWKSFRAALKVVCHGHEIARLEGRLERTQNAVTLQLNVEARYGKSSPFSHACH